MDTQTLKALIKDKFPTQRKFSEHIGITEDKLSRIIKGEDEGSFAVFQKIVEGLELDPLQAWELLFNQKYEKPVPELVPDAVSLIKKLQADIADLQRDRDKVFKWVEGFGKS